MYTMPAYVGVQGLQNSWVGKMYNQQPVSSVQSGTYEDGTFASACLSQTNAFIALYYQQNSDGTIKFCMYGKTGALQGIWLQLKNGVLTVRDIIDGSAQAYFIQKTQQTQIINWGNSYNYGLKKVNKTNSLFFYQGNQQIQFIQIKQPLQTWFQNNVGKLPPMISYTNDYPHITTNKFFQYKDKLIQIVKNAQNQITNNNQSFQQQQRDNINEYQDQYIARKMPGYQQQAQHPFLQKLRAAKAALQSIDVNQMLKTVQAPLKDNKNPFQSFNDSLAIFCQKLDVFIKRYQCLKKAQITEMALFLSIKLNLLIQFAQQFRKQSNTTSLQRIKMVLLQIQSKIPGNNLYPQLAGLLLSINVIYQLISESNQIDKKKIQEQLSTDILSQQQNTRQQTNDAIQQFKQSKQVQVITDQLLDEQQAFIQSSQKQLALALQNKIPLQTLKQLIPSKYNALTKYADRTVAVRQKLQKIKKKKKGIKKNRLRIKIKLLSAKVSNMGTFFDNYLNSIQAKFDLPNGTLFDRMKINLKLSNIFKYNVTVNNVYSLNQQNIIYQTPQLQNLLKKSDIKQIRQNYQQFHKALAKTSNQQIQSQIQQSFSNLQPYATLLTKIGSGVANNVSMSKMIKSQLRRQSKIHNILLQHINDGVDVITGHIDQQTIRNQKKINQTLNNLLNQLQARNSNISSQAFNQILDSLKSIMPQKFSTIIQGQGNILGAISKIKQEIKRQGNNQYEKYIQDMKKSLQLSNKQIVQIQNNTFLPAIQNKFNTWSNKNSQQLNTIKDIIQVDIATLKQVQQKNTKQILQSLGNVNLGVIKNTQKLQKIAQVVNSLKNQVSNQINQAINTGNAQLLIQGQTSKSLINNSMNNILSLIENSNQSTQQLKVSLKQQLKSMSNQLTQTNQLTKNQILGLSNLINNQALANEIVKKKLAKTFNMTKKNFQALNQNNKQLYSQISLNQQNIKNTIYQLTNQLKNYKQSGQSNMAKITQQIIQSMASYLSAMYSSAGKQYQQLHSALSQIYNNQSLFSQQTINRLSNLANNIQQIWNGLSQTNQNVLNLGDLVRNRFLDQRQDNIQIANFLTNMGNYMVNQNQLQNQGFMNTMQAIQNTHRSIIQTSQNDLNTLNQAFGQQLQDFTQKNNYQLRNLLNKNSQYVEEIKKITQQNTKNKQVLSNIISQVRTRFGKKIKDQSDLFDVLSQIASQFSSKQAFISAVKSIMSSAGVDLNKSDWQTVLNTYINKNSTQILSLKNQNTVQKANFNQNKTKLNQISQSLQSARNQIVRKNAQIQRAASKYQEQSRILNEQISKIRGQKQALVQAKTQAQSLYNQSQRQSTSKNQLSQRQLIQKQGQLSKLNDKINNYHQQVEKIKAQKNSIQKQLQRSKSSIINLQKQAQRLRTQATSIQTANMTEATQKAKRLASLQTTVQNLTGLNSKLQAQKVRFQQNSTLNRKLVEEKTKQINTLNSKISSQQNKIKGLQQQLSSKTTLITKSQSDLNNMKSQVSRLNQQLKSQKNANFQTQQALSKERQQVKKLNLKIQQQAKASGVFQQVQKQNRQLLSQVSAIAEQNRQLAGAKQKLDAQTRQLQALRTQKIGFQQASKTNVRLQTQASQLQNDSLQLKSKIKQLQNSILQKQKQIDTKIQKMGEKQKQLGIQIQKNKQIAILTDQKNKLIKQKQDINKQKAKQFQQLAKAKQQNKNTNSLKIKIGQLQNQVKQKQSQISLLNGKLLTATGQNSTKQAAKSILSATIQQNRVKISNLNQQLFNLKNTLRTKQTAFQDKTQLLFQKQSIINDKQNQIENLMRQKSRIQGQSNKKNDQLRIAKTNLRTQAGKSQSLQKQVDLKQRQIQNIANQKKDIQNQVQTLRNQILTLKRQVQQMAHSSKLNNSTIQRLNQQNTNLSTNNQRLKQTLLQDTKTIGKQKKTIQLNQARISTLQNQINIKTQQLNRLNSVQFQFQQSIKKNIANQKQKQKINDQLTLQIANLNKQLGLAKASITGFQGLQTQTKAQFDQYKTRITQKMNLQKSQYEKQKTILDEKIQQFKVQISNKSQELSSKIIQLQNALHQKKLTQSQKQNILKRLSSVLQQKSQLQRINEEKISKYIQQINQLEKSKESLSQQIANKQKQIRGSLEQKQSIIDQLTLQKSLLQLKTQSYQASNQQKNKKIAQITQQLSQTKKSIIKSNQKLQQVIKTQNQYILALSSLSSLMQVQLNHQQKNKFSQAIKKMKVKLTNLNKVRNNLQAIVGSQQQNQQKLIKKLKQKIQQTQSRIKQSQSKIQMLQKQITQNANQKNKKQTQINVLVEKTTVLEAKIIELTKQNQTYIDRQIQNQQKIRKLQKIIQQKTKDVQNMKKANQQLSDVNKQILQAKKNVQKLQFQNQQLKKKLSLNSNVQQQLQTQKIRVNQLEQKYKRILNSNKRIIQKYALILSSIESQLNSLTQQYYQNMANQNWQQFQASTSFILQRITQLQTSLTQIRQAAAAAAQAKPQQQTADQSVIFQALNQSSMLKNNIQSQRKRREQIQEQNKQYKQTQNAFKKKQAQAFFQFKPPKQSFIQDQSMFLQQQQFSQIFQTKNIDDSVLRIRAQKQKQIAIKQRQQQKKQVFQQKKNYKQSVEQKRPFSTIQQQLGQYAQQPSALFKPSQNQTSMIKIRRQKAKSQYKQTRDIKKKQLDSFLKNLNSGISVKSNLQSNLKSQFHDQPKLQQFTKKIQEVDQKNGVQGINYIDVSQGRFIGGDSQVTKLKKQVQQLKSKLNKTRTYLKITSRSLIKIFSIIQACQGFLLSNIKKLKDVKPRFQLKKQKTIQSLISCYDQTLSFMKQISNYAMQPFGHTKLVSHQLQYYQRFRQYMKTIATPVQLANFQKKINNFRNSQYEEQQIDDFVF